MSVVVSTAGSSSATIEGSFFARYGTAVLRSTDRIDDDIALHAQLVRAIEVDSRVVAVRPGAMNPVWTRGSRMYPAYESPMPDVLLSGSDQFFSVRFSDALLFDVQVPAKNQPEIYEEVPVPERYLAAWDGVTLVVMWVREGDLSRPPAAAGQVVFDVLRVAIESLGYKLYIQPCSANCELLFGHSDVVVDYSSSAYYSQSIQVANGVVNVSLKGDLVDLQKAEALHDLLKQSSAEFAHLKNLARRIIEIEQAARLMTIELIAIDYRALQISQRSLLVRVLYAVLDRWPFGRRQSASKRAAYLIASLWLAMASIETLQRSHAEDVRDLDDAIADTVELQSLFELDLKSDEAEVESIDLSFVRAAIEHKSARMDSRLVVTATVGGAVAGGAVGGLMALWAAISGVGGS